MVDWTDGPGTGGLFSFPSGTVVTRHACSRRHDTGTVTTAESRERRGPADGTGRSPPGAAAASWQPPRAQVDCRDCGTRGNSSSSPPRSARRAAMARQGSVQRTASRPLHPRSRRGLEAEPVQHLLHRDLPANCLEVDTRHGCCSLADGVVGCSRTVPFPFISIGRMGTISLT